MEVDEQQEKPSNEASATSEQKKSQKIDGKKQEEK